MPQMARFSSLSPAARRDFLRSRQTLNEDTSLGIEKTSLPKERNGSIKKSRNCQERKINNHSSTSKK
jgi:hypothetical protein